VACRPDCAVAGPSFWTKRSAVGGSSSTHVVTVSVLLSRRVSLPGSPRMLAVLRTCACLVGALTVTLTTRSSPGARPGIAQVTMSFTRWQPAEAETKAALDGTK